MLTKIKNWYSKYERPFSSLSLIGGFIFDALTLKRVDLFWENFWVVAHLVIVGTCIVLINAFEKSEGDEANPSKLHFWLTNIQQFFYGGIWSTYLVFYFRSTDIAAGWPFLLILALSFWANESLKRHFVRLIFQISLYFLAIFSFAIFLVPVLLHKIGPQIFLLAGLLSVAVILLFLFLVFYTSGRKFRANWGLLFGSIVGLYVLVNVLYFFNLIPPIPLSLKTAGVYYSVKKNSLGQYEVLGRGAKFTDYFNLYPNFYQLPGQPVFVYSAIFSPPELNIDVVHEWQHLNTATNNWETINRIPLHIVGGRDGGFRTYSLKTAGLTPGHWRVNVLTTQGQVIGRIRFNLILADVLPKVEQKISN